MKHFQSIFAAVLSMIAGLGTQSSYAEAVSSSASSNVFSGVRPHDPGFASPSTTPPAIGLEASPTQSVVKINEVLRHSQWPFATTNLTQKASPSASPGHPPEWQSNFEIARKERQAKQYDLAVSHLAAILEKGAPVEIQRAALAELALVALDENKLVKAQQIFAQYLACWSNDPSVPDILLREGLIYRQMGLNQLALSKFYSVMTSALVLKTDQLDYYRKLVLQAQVEIAETHYQLGRYRDAADSFKRLLESETESLNRPQIQFELIRSLAGLGQSEELVAQSQDYLSHYPSTEEVPEVRFCLASALKKLGRNGDALHQVMLLLQDQQSTAKAHPERLVYWQQRTGNEIANQLFQGGDFVRALNVYSTLAKLDRSAAWQIPVWYQVGIVLERLEQPAKAIEFYDSIIDRSGELSTNSSPGLAAVIDMARWRKEFLGWMVKMETTHVELEQSIAPLPVETSGGLQP
ncbi:MAG: tetratricopeptide repeat protein [Candidatus Omnitrophica bacterium]|nr:tetratricopeptide repeat protein [Candidatus Omnitrophota bacterium]